jgi:hypothetical protein
MGEFTHPNARTGYEGVGFGGNRGVVHATAIVELPTTALQTSDIVHLMYVPKGAVVVDGYVKADDLDTGTSLAYNIGDATTTTLFFSSTTTGQSAGSSAMATGARYTKFADATRLKMTVVTGSETAAAGTLVFGLSYFVDPECNVTTGITPISIA